MKKAFAEALVNEQGLHGFGLTDEQLQKSAEVKGLDQAILMAHLLLLQLHHVQTLQNPSLL